MKLHELDSGDCDAAHFEVRSYLKSLSNFLLLAMDNLHTGQLSRHFFFWQATILRLTQITPWGWIFRQWFFYNLKNSGQDLSNEGSNFILSSLEVGHWVVQTFFDKLPEMTYLTFDNNGKILNFPSFGLGHWQCKNWPWSLVCP